MVNSSDIQSFEITSNYEGINYSYQIADHYKNSLNLNFDQSFAFQTVLLEAIHNAIGHGNKGNSDLFVNLRIEVSIDEIILTIRDCGQGFDYKKIIDPVSPDNIFRESGRGLFLIKKLASKVHFNHKGSCITIYLDFKK